MKKKCKRVMKSIITFVLTAAMVFGAVPLTSAAAATGFMWSGQNGLASFDTGLGNESGTAGKWFVATDHNDGGESEVIWDEPFELSGSGFFTSDTHVQKWGGVSVGQPSWTRVHLIISLL